MNVLRVMLLGLAVVVLAAFGWRLSRPSRPVAPVDMAASPQVTEPAPAPAAPNPVPPVPPVAGPATPPVVLPAGGPAPPATARLTAQEARTRIDGVLPAAPDLDRAFDVLRAQFPTIAERSLTEATEAYRQSGVLPSPDDLFADALHTLRQNAGVLAAKAGPEALGAIFDMKATLLADLQQADPRICADFLFGGTSPEFTDFQASHRALIAEAAMVDITAIADGRTRQKAWGEPAPADFAWIEGELAKRGLSSEEIAALLDGQASDPAPPDARLCDNGRTYLAVLKSMPSDARNRVYGLTAELLGRS